MRIAISAVVLCMLVTAGVAQTSEEKIRINQIGYYPDAEKMAVVVEGETGDPFYIISTADDTLYTGTLSASETWSQSGETVRIANFSDLTTWGQYKMSIPSVGDSYYFFIGGAIHNELMKALVKGFYFQRATTELTSTYAGKWARPSGHPENIVYIHSSVESPFYQEGDILIGGSPKGWYDAGDYNKYIVNSGITTYTLLSLFEHIPGYFKDVEIDIPEKNNSLPDLLDEILWNLEWMLTMQDPYDGGVSHKLTSTNFTGTIMPHQDNTGRYYIQKSTAATLDFAAVMATAARVFADYEDVKPGFAAQCKQAAIDAWIWARHNPGEIYNQSTMNNDHNPDISTGAYGDGNISDEFDWAAAELYITTKADTFYTMTNLGAATPQVSSWQNVRGLPFISLAYNRKNLTSVGYADTANVKNKIIAVADGLVNEYNNNPYKIAVDYDFYWGSNAVIANKGIMLMQAYYLTKDEDYLTAAISNLDYLMGKNALGYCMVTGFGDKSPHDPHHRISEADGIDDPIPGLLVGGPNGSAFESCPYPSTYEAKRYLDSRCSYSTNEIAINWNAAIAYLVGAVEATELGYFPNEWSGLTPIETVGKDIFNPILYPNPTKGKVYIKSESEVVKVSVVDVSGNQLISKVFEEGELALLDTEMLATGVYFVLIENSKAVVTKKLVKH